MDAANFDALSRRLRSRRTALVGILGSVVAVLGPGAGEATAHNLAPACQKLKDAAKRRTCLRRARAHKRNKHTCKPKPKSTFCANRCGATRNNCKQKVRCKCPAGKICLANKGCSQACQVVEICPVGCTCGFRLAEKPLTYHCRPNGLLNCDSYLPCLTSASCPRGTFCGLMGCPGPKPGRCVPNCPF